jgi:hypothetical protein
VSGFISVFYFLHKQRLEEVRLFREIFSECNRRYDAMNEKLNVIIQKDITVPLSFDGKNELSDYFNLCGEEYLYFRQGFVYPDAWRAWSSGMRGILSSPRVNEYWNAEKKSESYYGLQN